MKLEELKARMEIPLENTSQDHTLQVALEDAIDAVQEHCNDRFIDSETNELNLPNGVKRAVAKLVKAYRENGNIQSQSLGDMRKSFFEGGSLNEVIRLLKPYVKKKKVIFR